MARDLLSCLAGESPSWRLIRAMRRFRKKGKRGERDPALTAAVEQVRVSLTEAERRRDRELRKLREERGAVIQPLRSVHTANHLSELAMKALLRRNS